MIFSGKRYTLAFALYLPGLNVKPLGLLYRWMLEEHVSYSYLFKFLPPEVKLVGDTFVTFAHYSAPAPYHQTLTVTQHLGNFIGVKAVKTPCLKDMIKHYTGELNLPGRLS